MTTELATRPSGELMPAFSIQSAVDRYNAVVEFTQTIMKAGKDYGKIPGTDKPTLLKPGAEKLCSFFGLSVDYIPIKEVEDWAGGFFYFSYKAVLTRHGETVATGIGSCNSKEKKYRWRNADRKCPKCGKETILNSKDGPGFFCWRKKGGCGANFPANDPAIAQQASGKVENTEPYDLVNTIQKMAQKRALVAATLIAANASEFYTQDAEDMEIIEGEFTAHDSPRQEHQEPPKTETKTAPRQQNKPKAPAVVLASAEQVKQFKDLLAMVQLPDGLTDTWLEKAGVDSWENVSADQIAKAITYLESRRTGPTQGDKQADYLRWYEHMESVAASVECPPAVFEQGLVKCMKAAKLTGKEWESTPVQRKQFEEALRQLAGFFAVPKEAVNS